MAAKKGYARVVFDEVAYAEDTVRGGRAGAGILRSARARFELEGTALSSLRRCEYLAFGVRHHPKDSRAETVYEIAHRRLWG